jgi:two-component system sensor histidine kinase/response regulator
MNIEELENSSILVVDDTPENLDVLIAYLIDYGFTILVAQSGMEAIELVEQSIPDIILLDVMMPPGIDGYETCKRLKNIEKAKNIPVIFMTALSNTLDKIKGFDIGGVDYITKPLHHAEVLARIKAHLTIRKLQQKVQAQNERLEKQNEQLKEVNASKDKFFSIIAHDLRNPLQVLLGYSELIIMNIENHNKANISKYVELILKTAKNLYTLLENLLMWSKVQKGLMEHNPQHSYVKEIVEGNIILFSPNAEQKQITLTHSVESQIAVYVDKNMINAVVRNLISNALKFTEKGGSVRVTAVEDDELVQVSVNDTGVGISKENMQMLFRIDVTHKNVGTSGERGSGLGLILCKELVEKNNGAIWVESEVGKGTTFTFTLPKEPIEGQDNIHSVQSLILV